MTGSAAAILEHYSRFDEATRLTGSFGELEFARMKELIAGHLTHAPADIADIGGGTGAYAFWLASLGHRVHLVDLVPRHIDVAAARMADQGPALATIAVGDARDLAFPDGSFDIVLLAGPLYHLVDGADRRRALLESRRVLRDGGLLLAVAINRYAGLIYGLTKDWVFDPAYLDMTTREVSTGIRTNPPAGLPTFREAFFHQPTELTAELDAAGFDCGPCLGVVGPAWQVPNLDTAWQNESRRRVLMSLAKHVERESVLSPQLFCAARRR